MRHLFRAGSLSLILTAVASGQVPAGGEFRVNTYTTGAQCNPRPAMEPDGDFVVVWDSDGQEGSNYGIFGQRFAPSGAPRGVEFQINTFTTGYQVAPSVAVGSSGDFVVVWESPQDGSGFGIQGRRFDGAGNPLGGEFLVNSFTTGIQARPEVARGADGSFVATWFSFGPDGSSFGIAARRFDSFGSPVGAEFVVNTYTTARQDYANVAVENNGNFVIVWGERAPNRDGSGYSIFGQRYDASGGRRGSEFQVNSYTTGNQRRPSVSASTTGGFVVAWASQFGDGSGYAMFARRFDASGSALGDDFVVNTYTTGSQFGISGQVAHDARGNFVVTWQGPDGSSDGSLARAFSASGAPRGAEFRVNTFTAGLQVKPSVASDAVGNFVVAWCSAAQDGSGFGVFAQRYGDMIFADGFDPQ